MELYYKSTRNSDLKVSASKAILTGLAPDGGLFVPERIPALALSMEELAAMDYQETACALMQKFFTDFTEEELRSCVEKAYDEKFDTEEIAPLAKADGNYYLELFHGATIAFKDMALSILPHLMTVAARKNHADKEIVILAATSGDTGKAAMAGFADVEGTRIIVFYPRDGVSKVQKLQMVTQKGRNVDVAAIRGNFDQAQSGVKALFEDREFAEELAAHGYQFSSANSINIGRLVPQIVYYVYAYARLVKYGEICPGDPVNVVVPTGNFGNILAAYYAKQMGLPLGRLVCASNENKVLYDFFRIGTYDKNREFVLTTSPSMDILISSNLERLLYLAAGEDAAGTAERMRKLKVSGRYEITAAMKERLADFDAGYADESETAEEIRRLYEKTGYVIDPHTAVASHVCREYQKRTGDGRPCMIASTASPYKFAGSVLSAIDPAFGAKDEMELLADMPCVSGRETPMAIREIREAEVLHKTECDPEDMKECVKRFLGM